MNKKQILVIGISLLISCFLILFGSNPNTFSNKILGISSLKSAPRQLYHVYLAGESIGIIESKKDLENYIDSTQNQLKQMYQVDRVYAPNDLDIVKEITYDEEISTTQEVYQKIIDLKGTSSFTIDGYKIFIQGLEKNNEDGTVTKTDDLTLYVLDKDVFTNSVDKTITAFIDPIVYEEYLNDTQEELEENEEGSLLENLYIENDITISQERIPAGEKIYLSEDELSKFLLFGTLEEQKNYTVKPGDTIATIAEENKLSVEEFLIANNEFKTSQDLLYPGQVVKLGIIIPQFDLVEIEHRVARESTPIQTVYKDDPTQYVGYEKVEQAGQAGVELVTTKVQLINGEIKDIVNVKNVELVPSINKVVVRGTRHYQVVTPNIDVPVGIGSWVWPATCNSISSGYGYRWQKQHEGLDISGCGYGSAIRAANNGLVVESGYTDTNGNYIIIKHQNGYYTIYAHMASRTKRVGDIVMANDLIGTMGKTGYAFGVHLHFGLYNGYPFRGGVAMNPLTTIFR